MNTQKHSFQEWLLATRPWSFPASAMPVLVSLFYLFWKGYEIHWGFGVWALLNIMVFHASGNTWSDYFDYKKGVDAADTYGNRTLTDGQFQPRQIRNLALGLLAVASVFGLTLILLTGWPLLYIGIGGLVCTLLYPPLKYRALGDVVIFLAYSFLPTIGTSYVATGGIDWSLWIIGVPVGLITVSILHANNVRDIPTDARAHIKTFAMLAGGGFSRVLYCLEVLLPFVCLLVCVSMGLLPPFALLPLMVFFMAYRACRAMLQFPKKGPQSIADLDQQSAQLQLFFSLLLTAGFVLDGLW